MLISGEFKALFLWLMFESDLIYKIRISSVKKFAAETNLVFRLRVHDHPHHDDDGQQRVEQ